MLVRSKKDGLVVDGEPHDKGDEFDMSNSAAVQNAVNDDLIEIVVENGEPAPKKKSRK